MVQDMLELRPSAQKISLSLRTTPNLHPPPAISASLSHIGSVLISPERALTSKCMFSSAILDLGNNTTASWKMMGKEGEGYELEFGANAWSEEEDRVEDSFSMSSHQSSIFKESSSSISSCSTYTSEDGDNSNHSLSSGGTMGERTHTLTHISRHSQPSLISRFTTEKDKRFTKTFEEEYSSPEVFIQKLKTKNQKEKDSDSGFFTMRPKKHKKLLAGPKSTKRFSLKPRKVHSIEALEISHPALSQPVVVHQTETAGKCLSRSSAIRGKKGKKGCSQPTLVIPESSYSFEVTNVNVLFKGNTVKVACRGETPTL